MRIACGLALCAGLVACKYPALSVLTDGGNDAPGGGSGDGGAGTCPTCQLAAIEPAIANTGDTILLEGAFVAPTTVTFPGGATATATVLGTNRASVVVPDAATAGALSVTSAGTPLGAVPFRRASFALGPQLFEPYEQTTGARAGVVLAQGGYSPTVTVIGHYAYVIGGGDAVAGTTTNVVQRAVINADGTIGAFTILATTLQTARAGHGAVVIGNRMYIIGGFADSVPLDSIEQATIAADGTLGPFTTSTVTLTTGRAELTTAVIGNYIYAIGGGTAGTPNPLDGLGSVERAPIAVDGTLGTFSVVSGVSLSSPRFGHVSAVVGDWLYVAGGTPGGSSYLSQIERAPIAADGTLGAFVVAGALSIDRWNPTSVVLGDAWFVVGGYSGTNGNLGSVDRVTFAADGSVVGSQVVAGATLQFPRANLAGAVIGNDLYTFGGIDNTGTNTDVERASIDAGGAVATGTTLTGTLEAPVVFGASAVSGDQLYMLGGDNTLGIVGIESAPVGSDGSLGKFDNTTGIAFQAPREGLATAVTGHGVYVIGGNTESALTGTSEVSAIGSDGSLGTFATVAGVTLVTPTAAFTTAILGGTLYVIGGSSTTMDLTSVEQSTIAPDGTLGAFSTATAVLAVARTEHASVVIGTSIYVLGGQNSSGLLATVERATLAGSTLGAFSVVSGVTLVTPRINFRCAVIGAYLYAFGGVDANNHPLASIERAAIHADGTLGAFATVTATLATGLDGFVNATFGNQVYEVGGFAQAITNTVEQSQLQ
ncbi:MAG TPA: hypothetical protein VGG74_19340 [Kofleriaceae bacterium]